MTFFRDIYCQLYEKFLTKNPENKHLSSSRHLHRAVYAYWRACFPHRKLVEDENIILEEVFWKMFFATRGTKQVEEFWLIYFMMTTNMKVFVFEDNEEELKKLHEETTEGQFELGLFSKSFDNQLESDERDTLQQKIEWWLVVVERGGPIPNDINDYSFAELYKLYR